MITKYDASTTVTGACRPDTLRDEIRQSVYPGDPGRVIGVTVDMFERTIGEEIEIEYTEAPTEDESALIDSSIAAHDSDL